MFYFKSGNHPSRLDKTYFTKYKGASTSAVTYREILQEKYEGCIILNDLSEEDAYDLFKANVGRE